MKSSIIHLSGKNINLCPIRTDDEAMDLYAKWMNDTSINIWIGRNNRLSQYSEEVEWATRKREPFECSWNIVEKKSQKLIGNCDCIKYPDSITTVLGIFIGEEDGRDKGYGTEAISLMVNFAFNQWNINRVELQVDEKNIRAIKCYTKAGFVECGRQHEAKFANGEFRDVITMEILRKNYIKGA